ncbi:MAG: histidine--tRNA ligase, partial [Spirulina sp.]
DRQRYRDALVSFLSPYKDELDRDSQDRLDRNPLRILDSKDKRTQEIIKDAPSLLDYLGDESRQHFDRVQQMLSDLEIAYRLNPFVVRGLDYYTHTAFEIKAESLGNESTVCGGGRYDGLVSELGGKETPAVGWALGMERLVLLVTQLEREQKRPLDFYLVSRGDRAEAQALVLAQKLRYFGFSVELDLSGAAFGKQFKRADRSKATACLTIGDAEAENQTVNLKWMATQEQEAIAQTQLLAMTDTLKEKMKR